MIEWGVKETELSEEEFGIEVPEDEERSKKEEGG